MICQDGLDLIKKFEGCKLKAYPDPATGGDPWTIGFGHTGPDVFPGLVISQDLADKLLLKDLEKFELGVKNLLKVKVNQYQFASLVSFAFNCGLANLKSSTLLALVNENKPVEAVKQFIRWNKANGKVMAGLTKRREAEALLFAKSYITPV